MPGEYESFVSIDVWTMLFAWGNIVILFLFLRKILFQPVKRMIDERQKQIKDMYEDARKDKDSAATMRVEYEEKLEKAAAQGEEIIKTAVQRAQKQEEEILRDAQDTAAKTLQRAKEQVEMERKQALNQLKDEVSGMAVDIASAVIERNLTEEENSDCIDRFIGSLGETK